MTKGPFKRIGLRKKRGRKHKEFYRFVCSMPFTILRIHLNPGPIPSELKDLLNHYLFRHGIMLSDKSTLEFGGKDNSFILQNEGESYLMYISENETEIIKDIIHLPISITNKMYSVIEYQAKQQKKDRSMLIRELLASSILSYSAERISRTNHLKRINISIPMRMNDQITHLSQLYRKNRNTIIVEMLADILSYYYEITLRSKRNNISQEDFQRAVNKAIKNYEKLKKNNDMNSLFS